jgi:REP element-mobilizing transposase RayT
MSFRQMMIKIMNISLSKDDRENKLLHCVFIPKKRKKVIYGSLRKYLGDMLYRAQSAI